MTDFRLETVELDLPPLAGALSRRLHDAGVPVTPERPADFARALGLVRPLTRRRLYWTARGVFVSDPAHVKAFDAVFASIFGTAPEAPFVPDDVQAVAAGDDRPSVDHQTSPREAPARDPSASIASSSPGTDEDSDGAEASALARASDDERLAGKRFDALEPHELGRLYALMTRLELATPVRRTRRYERGRHGRDVDLRRTLRASLRSGGDPIRLARRRGGDHLRRLGARRPGARGPGDGAPRPPRPPDRVGQPAGRRDRVLGPGRRHGGRPPPLRRARERPVLRGPRRGGRRDRRAGVRPPAAGGAARRWVRARRAVGQRHAGAGQLGRDAERARAQPGQVDIGMVDRMTTGKTCIYPGCDRPAVPPHPLGGPQPAFCDSEEHNALTAHLERQRLASASKPDPEEPTRG